MYFSFISKQRKHLTSKNLTGNFKFVLQIDIQGTSVELKQSVLQHFEACIYKLFSNLDFNMMTT